VGYIILLVDSNGRCAFIDNGSVKSKRVCRSVIAAELYACAHAYDIGIAVKHSLDRILGRSVDIVQFTDSLTLFDCLVTCCGTSERRLQIDIAVLRQALTSKELSNVACIRTMFNPSDGLTRARTCDFLNALLRTHVLVHPIGKTLSDKRIG
jgi:hypothetical protein